jgi:hypothetical protein
MPVLRILMRGKRATEFPARLSRPAAPEMRVEPPVGWQSASVRHFAGQALVHGAKGRGLLDCLKKQE